MLTRAFLSFLEMGSFSEVWQKGGGDLVPPWKKDEDVLIVHRVRARIVMERARSSAPAVLGNIPQMEERYWQKVRDRSPPKKENIFDHAMGDHLLRKADLPLEEVHGCVRGHQDIATDCDGNVIDPLFWSISTMYTVPSLGLLCIILLWMSRSCLP